MSRVLAAAKELTLCKPSIFTLEIATVLCVLCIHFHLNVLKIPMVAVQHEAVIAPLPYQHGIVGFMYMKIKIAGEGKSFSCFHVLIQYMYILWSVFV